MMRMRIFVMTSLWMILLAAPIQVSSSSVVCLQRDTPTGALATNIYPRTREQWIGKKILVHREHNEVPACQIASDDCHIGRWDTVEVVQNSTGNLQLLHKSLGKKAKVYEATVDRWGHFIHGERNGKNPHHLFIIQTTDEMACEGIGSDPTLNYYGKSCSLYVLEMYPEDARDWQAVRPDQNGSRTWSLGPCANKQPGGGGGHDPPP